MVEYTRIVDEPVRPRPPRPPRPEEPASKPNGHDKSWPLLNTEHAHIGLPGEIVAAIEPNTEADPNAILINFLVAFGNAVGRYPYFQVEADHHYSNLFALFIGQSSIGRKGTSEGRVRQIMNVADEGWAMTCRHTGLSSGEGLIYAARDPVHKMKGGESVCVDEGAKDKRLMIVEHEFGSTLTVMKRDGNRLSNLLREAWDSRQILQSMVKNDPNIATNAHISIVGHITGDELLRELDRREMANGFANRFLFVCTKRSRLLPFGGGLSEDRVHELGDKVMSTLGKARTLAYPRIRMTAECQRMWKTTYEQLSVERPGLHGAITARAEAQTIRLALVYALACGDEAIDVKHLQAALAVWRYSEASAGYVFGAEMTGDPLADEILRSLRNVGTKGMTRTDIRDLFGRNRSAAEITTALGLLQRLGHATSRMAEPGPSGGRGAETWHLT
jgi:hypothetical protein